MKRILLVLAALTFTTAAYSADALPENPRGTSKGRTPAPHNPNESVEAQSDNHLEPMVQPETPCAAFLGGHDENASGMYDDARDGDSYAI